MMEKLGRAMEEEFCKQGYCAFIDVLGFGDILND